MRRNEKIDGLEHVRCGVCGSDSAEIYHRARSRYDERMFAVVRCSECGLIYVSPRPARKELSIQHHSSDEILAAGQQDTFTKEVIERDYFLAKARLALMREFLPGGRVLDFGCGNGTFVYTALSEGWDAVGIDLNQGLVKAGHKYWTGRSLERGWGHARLEPRSPLSDAVRAHGETDHLFAAPLSDFASRNKESFDLINSSQVLEHVVNPSPTVVTLASMLKPGGYFIVDVPNIRCWKELVKRGSTLDPTAHLYYFSRSTLGRLLEEGGLEVLHTSARMTFFGVWMKLLPAIGLTHAVPRLTTIMRRLPTPGLSTVILAVAQKK